MNTESKSPCRQPAPQIRVVGGGQLNGRHWSRESNDRRTRIRQSPHSMANLIECFLQPLQTILLVAYCNPESLNKGSKLLYIRCATLIWLIHDVRIEGRAQSQMQFRV
ncbi:unnamed protein product [Arctogadus glacialis]